MKISDVATVNSTFRLYRKVRTLSASIEKRLDYYTRKCPDLLPRHTEKATEALQTLSTIARLDIYELNSQTTPLPSLLVKPVKEVMAAIFDGLPLPGKAQHSALEAELVRQMTMAGRDARGTAHRTTLAYHIALRAKSFMLFDTLTVAPGEYYKVFHRESTAFQTYLRKVKALTTNHEYFAVVEEGAQYGRLHIHVLHFMDTLPPHATDPNYGRIIPDRRELTAFKALWPYGFSSPLMVRYSPLDAYGSAGYRWPYDTRTKKAYTIGSPQRISSYMTKYITKSYSSKKRETYLWRIRKTHGLGLKLLAELLSMLTPPQLLQIASDPSLHPRLNQSRIPPRLLRLAALRLYQNSTTITKLAALASTLSPVPSPLLSLRASISGAQSHNPQNSIPSSISTSNDTATSETWAAIKKAAQALDQKYFARSNYKGGTASVRDHITTTDQPDPKTHRPLNSTASHAQNPG